MRDNHLESLTKCNREHFFDKPQPPYLFNEFLRHIISKLRIIIPKPTLSGSPLYETSFTLSCHKNYC
jgi:hypothetical protein